MADSPAVRRALKLSIWDGLFANLYANLTGGVFLVGYAIALKASEVQIGLLAAFPLLANIIQPFSTYLIELTGRRHPLALLGGALARLIWLVLKVKGERKRAKGSGRLSSVRRKGKGERQRS